MADKPISELTPATEVLPQDLFVMEQSGVAKKLQGFTLETWLLSFQKVHGTIKNWRIEAGSTPLNFTLILVLTDDSEIKIPMSNGKGISSIEKVGTSGLVDTYQISFNDNTSFTFTVTNGAQGPRGDNTYTFIKYATTDPSKPPHSMGDLPDNWLGIYAGSKSSAPALWSEYKWYEIKGTKGDTGAPATVKKAITEYQVSTNGTVIPSGVWLSSVPNVPKGRYLWTRTTITFNSGSPVVSYGVSYIGIDGAGTVSSVNNTKPDFSGDVTLTPKSIGALANEVGSVKFTNLAEDAKGVRITQVWKNASPKSDFPAQTITLGQTIQDNDLLMIIDTDGRSYFVSKNLKTGMISSGGFANLNVRNFTFNFPNSIEFEIGFFGTYNSLGSQATASAAVAKPIAIYLMKGVK